MYSTLIWWTEGPRQWKVSTTTIMASSICNHRLAIRPSQQILCSKW